MPSEEKAQIRANVLGCKQVLDHAYSPDKIKSASKVLVHAWTLYDRQVIKEWKAKNK